MGAVLDFNRLLQPVLTVTLSDPEKTTLHVNSPSLELVREIQLNFSELVRILSTETGEELEAAYDLAAKVMSCNREKRIVTHEELKKCGVDTQALTAFFVQYVDFLEELKNAKN